MVFVAYVLLCQHLLSQNYESGKLSLSYSSNPENVEGSLKDNLNEFYLVSDSRMFGVFSETILNEMPSIDSLVNIFLLYSMKETLKPPFYNKNLWSRLWLAKNFRPEDTALLSRKSDRLLALNKSIGKLDLEQSKIVPTAVTVYSDLFASYSDPPPSGIKSHYLFINLGIRELYQDLNMDDYRQVVARYFLGLLEKNTSQNIIIFAPTPYLGLKFKPALSLQLLVSKTAS